MRGNETVETVGDADDVGVFGSSTSSMPRFTRKWEFCAKEFTKHMQRAFPCLKQFYYKLVASLFVVK